RSPLSGPSRYPLTPLPYDRDWFYWDLEIHWSRYYLPSTASDLGRVTSIKTDCGETLVRGSPFFSPGVPFSQWLLTKCPACRNPIDAMDGSCRYDNPWTQTSRPVTGMGLHRFAIRIDCGKSVPDDTCGAPALR